MIQRIQTVYLFVATVLLAIAMSVPVGYFYTETSVAVLSNLSVIAADGTSNYTPGVMFVLLFIAALLAFVTIFFYKKRMRQIRLAIFSNVVLVAYYLIVGIYAYSVLAAYGSFTPSWAICLPFISLVLNWLAIRGIKNDEKLVRSYNTIR